MSRLRLCSGPPCPRCGCRDVEILEEFLEQLAQPAPRPDQRVRSEPWWGLQPRKRGERPRADAQAGLAVCRHCGLTFAFVEQPAPIRQQVQPPSPAPPRPEPPRTGPEVCPDCGGQYWAYRTMKGFQYRRCKQCGKRGKTPKTP